MNAPAPLATQFLAAVRVCPEVSSEERARLDMALRQYLDAARHARPELVFDDADFVRYLAERTGEGEVPPVAHAGDFALAFACTRGDPRALAAFHAAYSAVIGRVLARRGAGPELGEDAAQTVHERLLVGGSGAPPKIGEYRGSGPLRSWVSTMAATTLLMMQRAKSRRREQSHEDSVSPLADHVDPELGYLKERYRAHVQDAIVESLAKLGDRERTLLRLHLGQQMSIDQLGVMYRVNRATAARWLAAARRGLVEGVRTALRTRLGLSESECNSVVALVRSQLAVSIVRHLS
jgi:RNA polymerase sigma-70 factor (ECF subfamily)